MLALLLLPPQTVLRVDVQLQQVVITVRDDEDRIVRNLRAEDFILEDNGAPQAIAHFVQDSETPISLGILMDTSGSMASMPSGTISALRAAIGTTRLLMKLMKPGDEFNLMTFDTAFSVRQPFTQDRAKIEDSLRKLRTSGNTNLFPAVERGLQELKKSRYRKKALILITDAIAGGNFNDLQRAIRESEVLVYTFAIRGATSGLSYPALQTGLGRGFPGPIPPPSPRPGSVVDSASQRLLDTLAIESGGQSDVFDMNSDALIERMVAFVEDIAAELRGQYTIGYYPQNTGASENHNIRVVSKSPKYHVRVRREIN
jgi:VWFA-related protein